MQRLFPFPATNTPILPAFSVLSHLPGGQAKIPRPDLQ